MREGTGADTPQRRGWSRLLTNQHIWFSLLGFAGAVVFKWGPVWSRWLGALMVVVTFYYERQDFFRMLAVFLCGREYIDEGRTYRYMPLQQDAKVTEECHRSRRVLHLAHTSSCGMTVCDYFSHEPFDPLVRARGKLDSASRIGFGVQLKDTEVKALLELLDTQDERFKGAGI